MITNNQPAAARCNSCGRSADISLIGKICGTRLDNLAREEFEACEGVIVATETRNPDAENICNLGCPFNLPQGHRIKDHPSMPDETAPELLPCPTMDWDQVTGNGGPPCFAVLPDDLNRFCGRAERWQGHPSDHRFISLEDVLAMPLCPIHRGIERRNELVLIYSHGCVACSLTERDMLLDLLAPLAPADKSKDSLTVLRELIDTRAQFPLDITMTPC